MSNTTAILDYTFKISMLDTPSLNFTAYIATVVAQTSTQPTAAFITDVAYNSFGSLAVMLIILLVLQMLQHHLKANPTVFVRYPALTTKEPHPHTSIAVSVLVAILFGLAMAIAGITTSNPLPPTLGMALFRLAGTLFVYDFGLYLVHVMQHFFPICVKYHKIHHEVALYASDVTNGALPDFVEAFVPILIVPTIMQFNIIEVWVLASLLQIHGAIAHAGCSIPIMDWCEFALVGPRFHSVHHLLHRGNYGTLFTIWDHIVGTAISTDEANKRVWRYRGKSS
ncbi:hypothetical protein BASA50_002894 [Batrachochytrium salamandrivorans]|uniref:Fatty acid hydroxylase domain-containing protein n=1 Tax=Batrachochytrium salamandrivorans TaxID=1357716 RepID=A0ABQ8FMP9_9FUNG|nr:hypothetical protein BASA60_010605 [Batrachochytrium salamandrivorans]KAH6577630.1 hypothetical protein BASA62_000830 [Batrachochytrium salamandrivorans]KAH6589311.1 hypothetical protein BASA61_005641 [Batrachochytrium salamandrivorans]KAH6599551.1 hypothetical protein BASA50_002894 [Batrachochytrium salamandrivorans]KAH9267956.1 hypothetical protein BASA84_000421 [Batrachochytrium salamandrivorans]